MSKAQDLLNKVKAIKNTDPDNLVLDKTNGTLTGTLIGAGLGLLIGYTRKYNLVFSVALGAASGGVISKLIINK